MNAATQPAKADSWLAAARDISRLADELREARAAQLSAFSREVSDADLCNAAAKVQRASAVLKSAVLTAGYGLAGAAQRAGYMLAIEQQPLHGAGDGSYSTAVRVWPARR